MARTDVTIRDAHGRKQCFSCKEWLPEYKFGPRSGASDGLRGICYPCGRAYKKAWRSRRDGKADALWDAHKISREEFDGLLASQGGGCAICHSSETGWQNGWHLDHDHACCPGPRSCGRCTRGLLCKPCNNMLGMAKDNPTTLRAGADYLERQAPL